MANVLGRLWIGIVAASLGSAGAARAQLVVDGLTCDQRVAPAAVDSPEPRLGWVLHSPERGAKQSAYRVMVASSREKLAGDDGDLWDSGKIASAESVGVPYRGRGLRSNQACFWKVQTWDQKDVASAWSEASQWEMGLVEPQAWNAVWINDGKDNPRDDAAFYADDPAPCFRKEFSVAKGVKRARLHVSGLGYYEATINSKRVGDQWLDPGWTKFSARVFYSTFEVTDQLTAGKNCLGIMVGNGWYNPLPLRMWGHLNVREHLPVGRPRVIAQMEIEYADGTATSVVTDASWKVGDGAIRFDSVYLGERYDARREQRGWDAPGFDDSAWRGVGIATERVGPLQAQPQPPIRVVQRFHAARVFRRPDGAFIYDMGQNFAGLASFRFPKSMQAGTVVTFRYGELLEGMQPEGALNPLTGVSGQIKGTRKNAAGAEESVGGPGAPPVAWQTDTYIASGAGDEEYTPRFTFHGFRYVEVKGLKEPLPIESVVGLRMCADVASVGAFECSNERFNRIQAMCRRTFQSNLFSVQSDCPHRERFGYGGDIVATCDALMLNFDMSTFYAKVVRDFANSAMPDGVFTDTAPFVGIQYCGVGWAMAHPLLVSQLKRYSGDSGLLAQQYGAAKRWLMVVSTAHPDGIIKEGLGDHESLQPAPPGPLVTAEFIQSARMLAGMAHSVGKVEDAEVFERMAARSVEAFQRAFVDSTTGKVGAGTQAEQSVALLWDLVPAEQRELVLRLLVENIEGPSKGHVATGILGTRCMLEALSREGRADLAYGMVNQTEFPGWGWMLENGATTLWEHWALDQNTFSHNHPMFGSVSQWFINWVSGIQVGEEASGCDQVVIRPQLVGDLTWARGRYASAHGMIATEWKREAGKLTLGVEIPVGVTALVYVPAGDGVSEVRESGLALREAPGVEAVKVERKCVVCRVGSGRYAFEVGGAK